jgi:hypothetical protein
MNEMDVTKKDSSVILLFEKLLIGALFFLISYLLWSPSILLGDLSEFYGVKFLTVSTLGFLLAIFATFEMRNKFFRKYFAILIFIDFWLLFLSIYFGFFVRQMFEVYHNPFWAAFLNSFFIYIILNISILVVVFHFVDSMNEKLASP